MNTRPTLNVVLLATLTLTGCHRGGAAEGDTVSPVVTVDVAPVLGAPIQRIIRASALLYPLQQAAMAPKIAAPIRKVYVEKGEHVRAGQLLVELEGQDLAGALKESQAAQAAADAAYEQTARATVPEEVQKAELEVRAAKATLDAAQALFDNRQRLYQEGAIAQKDVNEAQVSLSQARSQYEIAQNHLTNQQGVSRDQSLKAAEAQRQQAGAHADAVAAQVSYTRITSPINGVVTDRPLFAGESAQPGAPIITVMDLSQVIARVHVSQAEAAELKVGSEANIIGPDGAPVPGKVSLVSPALDPVNTTVEVWVQAANPNERLKAGASLTVELIARTVKDALVIPESALITSASGTTSVIALDSSNKPQRKAVTVGIRDAGKAQITDGLESGQRVVTTGAFELAKLDPEVLAKTSVQIQPPKEEPDDDAP